MSKGLAIACLPRTGSTWLMDLLSSHQDIRNGGELLHPSYFIGLEDSYESRVTEKVRVLSTYVENSPSRYFMYKYFRQHMEFLTSCYLQHNRHFVIILYRNVLAMFVSWILVHASSEQPWLGGPAYKVEKVVVDPEHFIVYKEAIKNCYTELKEHLIGLPCIEVRYEDLLAEHQKVCNFIFYFLGVTPCCVYSMMKKQRKKSLGDYIHNVDEIEDLIKSEWLDL